MLLMDSYTDPVHEKTNTTPLTTLILRTQDTNTAPLTTFKEL